MIADFLFRLVVLHTLADILRSVLFINNSLSVFQHHCDLGEIHHLR